ELGQPEFRVNRLVAFAFVCLPIARPPTSTLFPYTTLFRSTVAGAPSGRAHRDERPRGGNRRRCEASVRRHGGGVLTPVSRHAPRSEEHTSELQSQSNLVCRLLLEKKKWSASAQNAAGGGPL